MVAKTGITNTLECLELLQAVLGAFTKALSDGKVDIRDMPVLLALIGPLNKAIQGVQEVWPELKDLDDAERAQVWTKLQEVFKSVPGGIKLPFAV